MKGSFQRLWSSVVRRTPTEPRYRHSAHYERVLGTSLELQIISTRVEAGPEAERTALAEIDRLEAIFNAYNPASELSRWQATRHEAVPVSPELAEVLERAEHWRTFTKGAFNPASEALTRLWTEHSKRDEPPPQNAIAELLRGMQEPLWLVERASGTATRLTTLPVTLNAIAKGFIIDRAAIAASQVAAVREVLVNIGGDLRHAGTASLTVAIAHPRDDAENALPADKIRIHNQGLATSGDYRRGFDVGGRHLSHVLDPRTGQPAQAACGVSVLAPCSMDADALSTAFSVLAPEESLRLADALEAVGVLAITAANRSFANAFWKAHALKTFPSQKES